MTAKVAAITGGTGFLGRYCAGALAAAGWHVRLLVRRDPTHPLLDHVPAEIVLGDLADEAALSRLVRGASAVVHAAGAVKALTAAMFQATNVAAAGRLARLVARDEPACRFVHISSQAARCPNLSPYAASKREGETAVTEALGDRPWTILRPSVVYGPWDQASVALLQLANGRIVPVPAQPEPRLAMVHARDVAAAVAAFCAADGLGQTYEICDASPDGHAWRDILRLASIPGRPSRFMALPDRLFGLAGAGADGWSALTGRPSLFGRGKAREILHRDWRPDPALRPPPGLWTPQIGLADGLRETLAWWRQPTLA